MGGNAEDRRGKGMSITAETRRESYLLRPTARKEAILNTLGERGMTSREIAYEMGYSDLNAVKPRLTELKDDGRVVAVGKKTDPVTGRKVAIWRQRF